jgi:predicted nucleic acid-binding protein
VAVRLALETNRYADLCRGNARAVEIVEAADAIWLPFAVVGELRAGFAAGSQGPRNEAAPRRFLLKPGVGILYADEQTTYHYASVYRQLRKQGTPSRQTTCGVQRSFFNILSPCTSATATSTRFHSSCGWMRRLSLLSLDRVESPPTPGLDFEKYHDSPSG